MKILLLRPYSYIDKEDFPHPVYEPLALELLASTVRKENEVIIVDCIVEGWNKFSDIKNKPNMVRYGLGANYIKKQVEKFKPDVVGITFLSLFDDDIIFDVVSMIKKINPKIKIVVGGVYASTVKGDILKRTDNIDILVIGEGDYTLRELIDSNFKKLDKIKGIMFKKDGQIVYTEPRPPIEDLDVIPLPSRDLMKYRNYSRLVKYQVLHQKLRLFKNYRIPEISDILWLDNAFEFLFNHSARIFVNIKNIFKKEKDKILKQPMGNILSSRGCPNRCNFCTVHNVWGYKYRMRSAGNILKEIDILVKKYKIKTINFLDDNFTVSKKRTIEICKGIIKRNYKINLNAASGTFLPSLDEETIKIMKKAGFIGLAFGVETGNQETMLNVIGKYQELDKVREVVNICKKQGIKTTGFFIIGIPGETIESMKDTIRFAKETPFDRIELYTCQAFPGSRLYEEAIAKGYLSKEYKPSIAKVQRRKSYFKVKEFSPEDVEKLYVEAKKHPKIF